MNDKLIWVASGCSFTEGQELWEEKNIPNYTNLDNPIEAYNVAKRFSSDNSKIKAQKFIENERTNLTYTQHLKNTFNCEMHNIGKGGSSQVDIVSRTIKKLAEVRKNNPESKIVCTVQDTSLDRIWIWQEKQKELCSFVLPVLDKFYKGKLLEALEIKEAYVKYISEQVMHMEYYMQSLAIQNYCSKNDISYLHFHMWDNQHSFDESLKILKELFFDETYCIAESMVSKLKNHYGDEQFYLPGLHVNCASHKLIAKWLEEEVIKRNLI